MAKQVMRASFQELDWIRLVCKRCYAVLEIHLISMNKPRRKRRFHGVY